MLFVIRYKKKKKKKERINRAFLLYCQTLRMYVCKREITYGIT